MDAVVFTIHDWYYRHVDVWIGGHRPGGSTAQREPQVFPPEGREAPMSRDYPGIVVETAEHSWCYIAYRLPEGRNGKRAWKIRYRRDIDERATAQRIRHERERRRQG
jgi:hypothetical protein